jgi:cytochrome c2
MNKFGFELTATGWVCVGKIPVYLKPMDLEVLVKEGNEYDRVHVYLLNKNIKSIFVMLSKDNVKFDSCYREDNILLMWENSPGVALAVGYKNEVPYFGSADFIATDKVRIQINIVETTQKELGKNLAALNRFHTKENKILADLMYQKKFYQEKLRKERLEREHEFISRLEAVAFPCECEGKEYVAGKKLFKNNCIQCHSLFETVVGPPLRGITSRRGMEWIVAFISNSNKLKAEGDEKAMALHKEYNNTEMPSFPNLSQEDIYQIIKYVDCLKDEPVESEEYY